MHVNRFYAEWSKFASERSIVFNISHIRTNCPRTLLMTKHVQSLNIYIISYVFFIVKRKYQYINGIYSQNTNISLVVFLLIMLYNIITGA